MKLKIAAGILAMTATMAGCGKSNVEAQTTDTDTTTTTMTKQLIIDSVAPGDTFIEIETTLGTITVQLYGDTPIHRDNFVKLTREGFYDGVLFHRVIRDFMIQTGDPESKNAKPGQMLGNGDPGYTLPAEFVYPKHFHRYGAVAAARLGDNVNPERRSCGSQFYIVTGQTFNKGKLDQMDLQLKRRGQQEVYDSISAANRSKIIELRRQSKTEEVNALRQKMEEEAQAIVKTRSFGMTAAQREAYETVGGTPHLDGQYTVFGQVVDGMDVVEKIQSVETNNADRPNDDVKIVKITVKE